jgi:hypothetical protein
MVAGIDIPLPPFLSALLPAWTALVSLMGSVVVPPIFPIVVLYIATPLLPLYRQ